MFRWLPFPGCCPVDLIVAKGRATARGLIRNFGILIPRLAFAGFIPCREGGAIGREEIDFIIPAIEILREEGIDATGPSPPTRCSMSARARHMMPRCAAITIRRCCR